MAYDLATKSPAELRTLMANAERVLGDSKLAAPRRQMAESMLEAAKAELGTRRVLPTRASTPADATLAAARARIVEVVAETQARFDLSPAASGVSTPHRPLSANGQPKTGGGVKTGRFRHCPYTSYRGRGGIAMLQYAVPPGDGAPYWSGGLVEVGSAEANNGLDTPMEEEEAIEAFTEALAKLATEK
jgi:hypothetical protein